MEQIAINRVFTPYSSISQYAKSVVGSLPAISSLLPFSSSSLLLSFPLLLLSLLLPILL